MKKTKMWVSFLFLAFISMVIIGCGSDSHSPSPPGVLAVTTASLPGTTVGTAYSQALAASGGTTPYTWSISAGVLPAGLSLNTSTGVISGTPTTAAAGTNFTVMVTDSATSAGTATKVLSITVIASGTSLSITTTSPLAAGVVGTVYGSVTLVASGGTGPYTWTVASGSALPTGLTLSTAGVISGTPSVSGTTVVNITVTDANAGTVTKALSITVSAASAALTISGVASSGAPMSGSAFLKDSANNPEMNTPIDAQTGKFSFNVSGKTAPYMLRAGTLYSMSNGPGTANINPLTHLMVANAAGFTNMSSMNAFYNNPSSTEMNTISGKMGTALTTMQTTMQQLLTSYNVATVNPITAPITIGQGMDRMFDDVKMAIDANGNVTMMYVNGTAAGTAAYTGPMGNMSGGMMGTVITPPTTPPVSGITITPSLVRMQVNATQQQQFTATGLTAPVTWSVAPATGGGSITTGGLYTGPNVQGMFIVMATGADGKSATATVQMGSGGMMM